MDVVHLASQIARSRSGSCGIEGRFLGRQSGDVPTASGAPMYAEGSWEDADVDILVLPSLAGPYLELARRPAGLADWVTGQHGRGCQVLAMTTGSWLLAETGLLDGHAATTHWAFVDRCRRHYPAVDWTSELPLTITGRLVTARHTVASATALCHAMGGLLGASIAERTYEYALIDQPGSGTLPLLHTIPLRRHGDPQVLAVQDWFETRFAEPVSATEAARVAHLSARQLRRRFLAATGQTPSAYLTDVRLARARALLLSTDEVVAHVAEHVGYHDPSTFTALFKQRHGLTPTAYRQAMNSPLS